jgi:hypothetical protein
MPPEQSFQNHSAYDTLTHFILVPLFFLNLLYSIYTAFRTSAGNVPFHIAYILVSLGILLLVAKQRNYTLRIQDRVIRLEERLRLAALVPAADLPRTHVLTERQLIALRFAPDEELPSLALRAAAENLSAKQIKSAITNWRPDHFRV